MFQSKLKVAAIHLLISIFVLSFFLLIAFFIWYPSPYSEINGLENFLVILVSVDLILGPLITFIIFKKKKPHLKFDLSVIASIQLAALAYGMFTIHQGHPVYVVYAVDRFELISAKEAEPERAKHDEFKVSTFWFPKLAYAKMPESIEEKNKLMFEQLAGKPDLERRPEYYKPIKNYKKDILDHGIAPDQLFSTIEKKTKLQYFLKIADKKKEDFAYLPLVGKSKDVVIAINRKTGELAGTIDIDPWVKG